MSARPQPAHTHGPHSDGPLVEAVDLVKVYLRGDERVQALRGVSLSLPPGDFCCLLGPSGAGKTTLLNLVGALDTPTSGRLRVAGLSLHGGPSLPAAARDRLRRERIGFVFTEFFLVPTLSAIENVLLPQLWTGRQDRRYAEELLGRVGLGGRLSHRPSELSGGEMQRVAIARALANRPALLLADEPTGNVDTATRDGIMALFRELNAEGLTILLATHDQELADGVDRVLPLSEGRIADA